MHHYEKVSSSEALQLIQYAVQEVEKRKASIAIAVSGPEGELIAFVIMDGVKPTSSQLARNRAYTAAMSRTETSQLGERMRTKDNPAFWGDDRITGFGGGIPIIQNNKVIGGLGISGLPEADDISLAKEAIKKVFGN